MHTQSSQRCNSFIHNCQSKEAATMPQQVREPPGCLHMLGCDLAPRRNTLSRQKQPHRSSTLYSWGKKPGARAACCASNASVPAKTKLWGLEKDTWLPGLEEVGTHRWSPADSHNSEHNGSSHLPRASVPAHNLHARHE